MRGINEGNMLLALQFCKGLKKKELTFLTTLKMVEGPKEV